MLIIGISYVSYEIFWSNYSWRHISTVEQMRNNGNFITQRQLSERIHHVIDSLKPGLRSTTMTESVVRIILSEIIEKVEKRNCKCYDIGYFILNTELNYLEYNFEELLGDYWAFGYGLEKFSSTEACFDFWLNYGIFYNGHHLTSLDELSEVLFLKPTDKLSKNELTKLLIKRLEIN